MLNMSGLPSALGQLESTLTATLSEVRATLTQDAADLRANVARDAADLRANVTRDAADLRANVARDLLAMQTSNREEVRTAVATVTSEVGEQSESIASLMVWQTQVNRCNVAGKFLAADGTCRFAAVPECATFTEIDTRIYSYNGPNAFGVAATPSSRLPGGQVMTRCKWQDGTRFYGPEGTADCVAGAWTVRSFPACRAVTSCGQGAYMSTPPTRQTDTNCNACPGGSFQAQSNTTARSCTVWRTCPAGQYVNRAGTAAADRSCAACPANTIQLSNGYTGTSCMRASQSRIVGTGCSASSQYSGSYHCRFAYNNNWNDGGGRAWATRGQGAGSWYRMTFRASYTNMVRFRQRGCGCEWYRRAQLEFSNGQRRTIQIGRNYNIQTLRFDWVGPVTWVMIRFDQQWSRTNNGANEIMFMGFAA
jgi:hypothetical protein